MGFKRRFLGRLVTQPNDTQKTHDTNRVMKKMKHSHHLVLKSRIPVLRLKRNKTIISSLLLEISERFQVKVYNNSLNSNHIHLLVKSQTQKDLQDFLRVLAGQIAQRITGAVRGKKNKLSFCLKSAWKRMVHWGRDFLNIQKYIYQNQLETLGLIPYQPRTRIFD
jgi:hypothetical protein